MATHCRCNIVSSQLYLLLFHNYGKSNNVFLSCYKMFLLLRCECETLDLLFKHDVTLTCTSHINSITDQSHLPSHWQSPVKAFQVHEIYLIVQRCNKNLRVLTLLLEGSPAHLKGADTKGEPPGSDQRWAGSVGTSFLLCWMLRTNLFLFHSVLK